MADIMWWISCCDVLTAASYRKQLKVSRPPPATYDHSQCEIRGYYLEVMMLLCLVSTIYVCTMFVGWVWVVIWKTWDKACPRDVKNLVEILINKYWCQYSKGYVVARELFYIRHFQRFRIRSELICMHTRLKVILFPIDIIIIKFFILFVRHFQETIA